jgi:hypothetical protein
MARHRRRVSVWDHPQHLAGAADSNYDKQKIKIAGLNCGVHAPGPNLRGQNQALRRRGGLFAGRGSNLEDDLRAWESLHQLYHLGKHIQVRSTDGPEYVGKILPCLAAD